MGVGRFIAMVGMLVWRRSEGRYLLVKRSDSRDFAPGEWETGSGRLEQGEGFPQALRRECMEELGLDVRIECMLGVTHLYRGAADPENEMVGVSFGCSVGDASELSLSDEHSEHRWVTAEEAAAFLPPGHWLSLMTREGEVATQFSLHGVEEYYDQHSFFSPDGRTLVISARVGAAHGGEQVYRMPVTASRPELLFEPEPPDGCRVTHVRTNYSGTLPAYGQKGSRTLDSVGWSRNHGDQPRMILVDVYHYCPESDERGSQQLLFSWEGDPLLVDAWTGYAGSILGGPYLGQDPDAQPPCGGSPSPDGRYVAWQEGFPDRHKWHGQYPETRPWNRVVIADADTCEPIFRVLSAYTYQLLWEAQWLANSEGFVVGVLGGHAIARVHPEPKLVRLPALPPGPLWADGPVPAPTGDGRYFAYEFTGVYDSVRDRWISPGFALSTDSQPHARREEFRDWGPVRWGENHEELRYESGDWDRAWLDEGWFGGLYDWTLLPPSLEIPPFDNNLSFVVARTGGCVDLREQPPEQALALDCLPDGTRVSLSGDAWGPAFPHPLSSLDSALVRVRTADGLEGWLPLDYLDHE